VISGMSSALHGQFHRGHGVRSLQLGAGIGWLGKGWQPRQRSQPAANNGRRLSTRQRHAFPQGQSYL